MAQVNLPTTPVRSQKVKQSSSRLLDNMTSDTHSYLNSSSSKTVATQSPTKSQNGTSAPAVISFLRPFGAARSQRGAVPSESCRCRKLVEREIIRLLAILRHIRAVALDRLLRAATAVVRTVKAVAIAGLLMAPVQPLLLPATIPARIDTKPLMLAFQRKQQEAAMLLKISADNDCLQHPPAQVAPKHNGHSAEPKPRVWASASPTPGLPTTINLYEAIAAKDRARKTHPEWLIGSYKRHDITHGEAVQ